MAQSLPTPSEMLRSNRSLPSELKQSCVLLRFAEPIDRALCGDFLRIHLTPMMRAGGEEEFYLATRMQPQRAGTPRCVLCRQAMQWVSLQSARCRNPHCRQTNGRPTSELLQVVGPVRGVVKLMTFPDFIHAREQVPIGSGYIGTRTIEWINALLLVLDRRYREEVLASVYRTAGMICDDLGFALVSR